MKYKNKSFSNETVLLDNNEYYNCTFNDCILEYSGGKPPSISDCKFKSPRLTFSGNAADTLNFMSALYHGGFKSLIGKTFDNIRANIKPSVKMTFH